MPKVKMLRDELVNYDLHKGPEWLYAGNEYEVPESVAASLVGRERGVLVDPPKPPEKPQAAAAAPEPAKEEPPPTQKPAGSRTRGSRSRKSK